MFVLLFDQKDYEKFDGNGEVVATIIWSRETYTFSAVLAARSCLLRPAKAVASQIWSISSAPEPETAEPGEAFRRWVVLPDWPSPKA
jgi:hypothetical protein